MFRDSGDSSGFKRKDSRELIVPYLWKKEGDFYSSTEDPATGHMEHYEGRVLLSAVSHITPPAIHVEAKATAVRKMTPTYHRVVVIAVPPLVQKTAQTKNSVSFLVTAQSTKGHPVTGLFVEVVFRGVVQSSRISQIQATTDNKIMFSSLIPGLYTFRFADMVTGAVSAEVFYQVAI